MATTEEEKKLERQVVASKKQPDAVEQAISDLESRAKERREFAASPVKIDTSGQPNWMGKLEEVRREYMESPEQKAAREKRERTNRRIAAISDGLVALSNVAGAMGGATPIKPASLSEAHKAAVERAAKRRRENAARFETAQRYYSGLQYKQDKLNADRYNDAVKARLDAGKQADTLQGTAARLRQTKANADRDYDFQKEKFEEQKEYNRKTLALRAERNAISRSKAGGGSSADETNAANRYWASLTEQEKQRWRDMFGRKKTVRTGTEGKGRNKKPVYGTKYDKDDANFINLVWKQRKAYLQNEGRGDEIRTSGFNRSHSKGTGYGNNNGKGRGY